MSFLGLHKWAGIFVTILVAIAFTSTPTYAKSSAAKNNDKDAEETDSIYAHDFVPDHNDIPQEPVEQKYEPELKNSVSNPLAGVKTKRERKAEASLKRLAEAEEKLNAISENKNGSGKKKNKNKK